MVRARHMLKGLALCLCLVAMLSFATGCRASDALKEIVYLQSADIIDYDNPQKYYISDSTSKEKSDQVSATETRKDDQSVGQDEQNLVVYSSTPNTDAYTTKKSEFSGDPDFNDIEASEEVFFYKSTDKDAVDHTVTKKEEDNQQNQQEDPEVDPTRAGVSGEAVNQVDDKGQGGNGEKATQEETPDEKTSEGGESDESAGKKARKTDPTRVTYDSSDPTQDPPTVEKIAAYGEFATIVELVAGKGALVATDAENFSGNFSKVFDTSKVVKGWSDGGTAKKMNVKKIVSSGAQVILTTDSAYLEALSNADFGKLDKAGIEVVVLRPMTCSKYIMNNVKTVGKMLDGTSAGKYASKAASRASDYIDFHNRVLKECISANGGNYAGKTVLQSNGKCDVDASGKDEESCKHTVLVDAYDKKAEYEGATLGSANWKPAKGLAYASAGYVTSPVSYYMQCGGVVNNAAVVSTKSATGEIPLWQFNYNSFGFSAKDWSGITVSLMENKAIKNSTRVLLDSGVNHSNRTDLGAGLGTESFPKLVVTSSDIEEAIIANSEKNNGMYHPYGWVAQEGSSRVIETFGVNLGNTVLSSTVGVDGSKAKQDDGNLLGDSIPDENIEVNPHGVFSDWTEGTVESFLEAAWVNDVICENEDQVDWEKEAEDFYDTFYDYDLSISELTD